MLHFLRDGVSKDKDRLKKLSEKYSVSEDAFDFFHDSLGDEFWMAEQAECFGKLLSTIGLYMLVENETKIILRWIFSEKQVSKSYIWKNLKKTLNGIGFNIEHLKMYKIINELRCLNNDIKHNRKVGDELAKYPGWVYGEEITGKEINFERFKNAVPEYIEELSNGINAQLLKTKAIK